AAPAPGRAWRSPRPGRRSLRPAPWAHRSTDNSFCQDDEDVRRGSHPAGTRGAATGRRRKGPWSAFEEPPGGESDSGTQHACGIGEFEAHDLAELLEPASDARMVQVEQIGGTAERSGGTVGLEGLQIVPV